MGYMSGGSYHKPLMEALKEAGFILKRRAVSSHYVMQRPLTDQLTGRQSPDHRPQQTQLSQARQTHREGGGSGTMKDAPLTIEQEFHAYRKRITENPNTIDLYVLLPNPNAPERIMQYHICGEKSFGAVFDISRKFRSFIPRVEIN